MWGDNRTYECHHIEVKMQSSSNNPSRVSNVLSESGISNTGITALFADSIPSGERGKYFTKRMILQKFGNKAGPLMGILAFVVLGNEWTSRDCAIVMIVGLLFCIPAMMCLCFLSDTYTASPQEKEKDSTDKKRGTMLSSDSISETEEDNPDPKQMSSNLSVNIGPSPEDILEGPSKEKVVESEEGTDEVTEEVDSITHNQEKGFTKTTESDEHALPQQLGLGVDTDTGNDDNVSIRLSMLNNDNKVLDSLFEDEKICPEKQLSSGSSFLCVKRNGSRKFSERKLKGVSRGNSMMMRKRPSLKRSYGQRDVTKPFFGNASVVASMLYDESAFGGLFLDKDDEEQKKCGGY